MPSRLRREPRRTAAFPATPRAATIAPTPCLRRRGSWWPPDRRRARHGFHAEVSDLAILRRVADRSGRASCSRVVRQAHRSRRRRHRAHLGPWRPRTRAPPRCRRRTYPTRARAHWSRSSRWPARSSSIRWTRLPFEWSIAPRPVMPVNPPRCPVWSRCRRASLPREGGPFWPLATTSPDWRTRARHRSQRISPATRA